MFDLSPLLPFVLILVAFYLLIIRPARKRQRTQRELLSEVKMGSRVMTTSGMFADVAAVHDDSIDLRVAPEVVVTFAKQAVARIVPPAETQPTDPDTAARRSE